MRQIANVLVFVVTTLLMVACFAPPESPTWTIDTATSDAGADGAADVGLDTLKDQVDGMDDPVDKDVPDVGPETTPDPEPDSEVLDAPDLPDPDEDVEVDAPDEVDADTGPCPDEPCLPGDYPDLLPGPCERLGWDPVACACALVTKGEMETCDDDDPCTVDTTCDHNGSCEGTPLDCDDDNPCTDDTCDTELGCSYTFNDDSCEDGNPCTLYDTCVDGHCTSGSYSPGCVTCDDADDQCEATFGDGDACNGELGCDEGQCLLDEASIVTCSTDGETECLKNLCDSDDGTCSLQAIEDGQGCSDGNPCTEDDACDAGECVGVFDDTIPGCACAIDDDCAPFEDADLCNGRLACLEGQCLIDPITVVAGCDTTMDTDCIKAGCNPQTGQCELQPVVDSAPCDDGNPCTLADACLSGSCVYGQMNLCEEVASDCTIGVCLPTDGSCMTLPANEGKPCASEDPCAAAGSCVAGACLTTAEKDCADENPCTIDSCDAVSGECLHDLVSIDDPETCNDLDDNCDGQTDEGLLYDDPVSEEELAKGADCEGLGACGAGVVECGDDGLVTCSTNPNGSLPEDTEEVCDGVDNDCDGLTDDDLSWLGTPVGEACEGVGACGEGLVECVIAEQKTTCSTNPNGSASEAVDELCDGLDNDCDGATDEDIDHSVSGCANLGVCNTTLVVTTCEGEAGWACDYSAVPTYQAGDEIGLCDQKDNDCDGLTDEDYPDRGAACDGEDADACENGTWTCATDGASVVCQGDVNVVEVCEGSEDEDCDGAIDEDDAQGCTTYYKDGDGDGFGAADAPRCLCAPDEASQFVVTTGGDCDDGATGQAIHPEGIELCNGVDDDCDGLTDGDDPDLAFQAAPACELADGVCAGATKPMSLCVGGAWLACDAAAYRAFAPSYEEATELSCDGLDNDCDGATDEDFSWSDVHGNTADGVGADCGVGACAGGLTKCKADLSGLYCSSSATAAGETCNGKDDDCDGFVDADDPDLASNDVQLCENAAGVCVGATKPTELCVDGAWTACEAAHYATHAADFEADTETSCDGLDNDCDGLIDEDFELILHDGSAISGVLKACGTGACAGGLTQCMTSGQGVICSTIADSTGERCNGIDDDCDGLTDLDDADDMALQDPQDCELQVGVCAGASKPVSLCTADGWSPCTQTHYLSNHGDYQVGAELTCDGLDNDCDGSTDEDFEIELPDGTVVVGVGQSCGVGACAGGTTQCAADGNGAVCSGAMEPSTEVCNGLDDDCDGLTDEDLDTYAEDCDCALEGLCTRDNVIATCTAGAWVCDYSAVVGYQDGVETTCDDLDNDCDGSTDEDFVLADAGGDLTKGDACGAGGCEAGVVVCGLDLASAVCSISLGLELCDGQDNDCDGATDEGLLYVGPNGTSAAIGGACEGFGACGVGTVECGANLRITCSSNPNGSQSQSSPEACDGLDNDCDGITDDGMAWKGLLLGQSCDGIGECGAGTVVCSPGSQLATCSTNADGTASEAGVEACDGLDNDCDGKTDAKDIDLVRPLCADQDGVCEGAAKPARLCVSGSWQPCAAGDYLDHAGPAYQHDTEALCDGRDNDCDGQTDEDFSLTLADASVVEGLNATCGAGACAGGITQCRPDKSGIRCSTSTEATSELCDGVDNDCDGKTDADDADDLLANDHRFCERQSGVCLGASKPVTLCQSGAWASCDADDYLAHAPTYEDDSEVSCDGTDNDCDGAVDDDFELTLKDGTLVSGVLRTCGVGACVGGLTRCTAGGDSIECPSEEQAALEVCNGVDDDCDGLADAADAEDLLANDARVCALQKGVCDGAAKSASLCAHGEWGACTAAVYLEHAPAYEAGAEESCDALDNDCDGLSDEDFSVTGPDGTLYTELGLSCGLGACAGGTIACKEDTSGITCDTFAAMADEICDGADNDCDGATDAEDALDLMNNDLQLCEIDLGVCAGATKPLARCDGGDWQACAPEDYLSHDASYETGVESLCDGADNDCDGEVDEDFELTLTDGTSVSGINQPCGVGACAGGLTACNGAGNGLQCPTEVNSSPELCDGADNDCDGAVDAEDDDLTTDDPMPCEKQSGVCAGTLKPASLCEDGAWASCADAHYVAKVGELYQVGQETSCDGKDNDCDGAADEDFSVTGPDGTTYTGAGESCGVGQCEGGTTTCDATATGIECSSLSLASAEICNNVDDDCDGKRDAADAADLLANDGKSCEKQAGVCAGATKPVELCKSGAWASCDTDTYSAHAPGYEADDEVSCDGLDNDCDSEADEEMPDSDGDGLSDCVDDDDDDDTILDEADNCSLVPNLDQADLDDDDVGDACDSDRDGDGDPNGTDCAPDEPAIGASAPELCNGLDDDCDGLTDADDVQDIGGDDVQSCEDQLGVCAGATKPARLCVSGSWSACDAAAYQAYSLEYEAGAEASCDGRDNDCDGAKDEDFTWQDPVSGQSKAKGDSCGAGECAGGAVVCSEDGTGLACSTDTGMGSELCDGIDNDCDGLTDGEDAADLVATDVQECEDQLGVCLGATKPAALCVGGAWQACGADTYAAFAPAAFEAGQELSCDGLDNDCDGAKDDDFTLAGADGATYTSVGESCGVGACAGGSVACNAAADGLACDTFDAASDEVCNGVDDDCDGKADSADDGLELAPCSNQKGVCDGSTHAPTECVNGSWNNCGAARYYAQPGYESGVEVSCDGLDNECDGKTDDDFTLVMADGATVSGLSAACGVGACAGGATVCNAAGDGITCDSLDQAGDEVCDGVDNDCDGATDAQDADDVVDGYFVHDFPSCDKTAGVCAGALRPASACVGGAWSACSEGVYLAHSADYEHALELTCDALDNDCDGGADEDFSVTGADGTTYTGVGQSCGVGACAGGLTECRASGQGITCTSFDQQADELCDGVDNDCDGATDATDADLLSTDLQFCELSKGVCAGATKPVSLCVGGSWQGCDATTYGGHSASYEHAAELACDGLDNDCNGQVDEDFSHVQLNGATVTGINQSCGVGRCAGGITTCNGAGDGIACPKEGDALPEKCNGQDDDCDGLIDQDDQDDIVDGFFIADKPLCEKQSGVCAGARKPVARCQQGGWLSCGNPVYHDHDATFEPGSEKTCDSLDNDCDGKTDAADGSLILPPCENQAGVCAGAIHPMDYCEAGSWRACDAAVFQSHAPNDFEDGAETRCDTKDNDCDDVVDEDDPDMCDDDDPLTSDVCVSGEGCSHPPVNDTCEDALVIDPVAMINIAGTTMGADDDYTFSCWNDGDEGSENASPDVTYTFTLTERTGVRAAISSPMTYFIGTITGETCAAQIEDPCFWGSQGGEPYFQPFTLEAGTYHVVVDTPYHEPGGPFTLMLDFVNPCDLMSGGNGIYPDGQQSMCNDDNPCTIDTCDHTLRDCVFTPGNEGMQCDTDLCFSGQACASGACTGGAAVTCDDGDAYTTDSCDPTTGCVFTPINDTCATARDLTGDAGTAIQGNLRWATHDYSEPLCAELGGIGEDGSDGNDVVYSFTLDARSGVRSSITPMYYNPATGERFYWYGGQSLRGAPCATAAGIACKAIQPNQTSVLEATLDAGTYYLIVDAAWNSGLGPYSLTLEIVDPCDTMICDDENPCTSDACSPDTADCVFTPLGDGLSCDTDACMSGQSCTSGACAGGAPVICDDGLDYTIDSCDPLQGCVVTPVNDTCDAAIAIPPQGTQTVVGTILGASADYSWGLCEMFGDGAEYADVVYSFSLSAATGVELHMAEGDMTGYNSVMYMVTPAACDASTVHLCGYSYGGYTSEGSSGVLPAGDYSLIVSSWSNGPFSLEVTFAPPCDVLVCDDMNPCTQDTCDPAIGDCVFEGSPFDGIMCDDDPCMLNQSCAAGVCQGGTPNPCDDDDPSTADLCEPDKGCRNIPANDTCATAASIPATGTQLVSGTTMGANDDLYATCGGWESPDVLYTFTLDATSGVRLHFQPGWGTGGADPAYPDGGEQYGWQGVAYLMDTGCASNSDLSCGYRSSWDSGQPPFELTLEAGTYYIGIDGQCCGQGGPFDLTVEFVDPCQVLNCDDMNPCTSDACDPATGSCSHVDVSNGQSCDTDPCVLQQTCAGGACQGGATNPCDDQDPNTTDSCSPDMGCVHVPGNDTCETALSIPAQGTQLIASDSSLAQDDYGSDCGGWGGRDLAYTFTLTATTGVTARLQPQDGPMYGWWNAKLKLHEDSCANAPQQCVSAWPGATGEFSATLQAGTYYIVVDGECCDQGGPFQLELAFGDPCDTMVCDDQNPCTDDTCDSATGTCSFTAVASDPAGDPPPCDQDPCNVNGYCQYGACVQTSPLSCDDDNPDTTDSCDPSVGCTHVAVNDSCASPKALIMPNNSVTVSGNTQWATNQHGGSCGGWDSPEVVYSFTLSQRRGVRATLAPTDWWNGVVRLVTGTCAYNQDGAACAYAYGLEQPAVVEQTLDAGTYYLVVDGECCNERGPFNLTVELVNPCDVMVCDDMNPCTVDSCSPNTGDCQFSGDQMHGAACELGPCQTGGACDNGACTGTTTPTCDDDDPTTMDSCDPNSGCVHVPANDTCEGAITLPGDGTVLTGTTKFATDDYTNNCGGHESPDVVYTFTLAERKGVEITFEPTSGDPNGGEEGHWWNASIVLQGASCGGEQSFVCQQAWPGEPRVLVAPLDPGTYHVIVDGECCDERGDFELSMTLSDPCDVMICDDQQPCTQDSCDPTTGTCVFDSAPMNDLSCDINLCDLNGTCSNGHCLNTVPPNCDDQDPDTQDECLIDHGCIHRPGNGTCGSALVLDPTSTTTLTGDTTWALDDQQSNCGGDESPDVVYTFTLDAPQQMQLDLSTPLRGWSAVGYLRSSCLTNEPLACLSADGEDAGGSGGATTLELAAGTYYLTVDGSCCGDAGPFELTITPLSCGDTPCQNGSCLGGSCCLGADCCPGGMTVLPGRATCVGKWEASRPDATSTSAGSDESYATSRAGVLPWAYVGHATAASACAAAGWRLCTRDELREMCQGPNDSAFPYGDTYNDQTCNTYGAGGWGGVATGSLTGCTNDWGAWDQSGNVFEWTSSLSYVGGDGVKHFYKTSGSYKTSDNGYVRCENRSQVVETTSDDDLGFRCCADLMAIGDAL